MLKDLGTKIFHFSMTHIWTATATKMESTLVPQYTPATKLHSLLDEHWNWNMDRRYHPMCKADGCGSTHLQSQHSGSLKEEDHRHAPSLSSSETQPDCCEFGLQTTVQSNTFLHLKQIQERHFNKINWHRFYIYRQIASGKLQNLRTM